MDIDAGVLHNWSIRLIGTVLDYVGRPAILKPYSGGGWKHVYKVHNQAKS